MRWSRGQASELSNLKDSALDSLKLSSTNFTMSLGLSFMNTSTAVWSDLPVQLRPFTIGNSHSRSARLFETTSSEFGSPSKDEVALDPTGQPRGFFETSSKDLDHPIMEVPQDEPPSLANLTLPLEMQFNDSHVIRIVGYSLLLGMSAIANISLLKSLAR